MSKKQIGQLATLLVPVISVLVADFFSGSEAQWHHIAFVIAGVAAVFGINISVKDDEEIKTP